jgi:two-component system, OmpR family, alkaline phosphatase synthesis response regulator PhoP
MAEKVRILVADDNRLQLSIIGDALSEAGFQVFTVSEGLAVVPEVTRSRPHMVMLDIMMPDTDGITVCGKLKACEETSDTLIVIYSSKKDLDLMDLAYEAGAAGFIMKSNDIAQIVARVKEIIHEKLGIAL